MNEFLLSLTVLLVTSTAVQAQFRGCYSAAGCSRSRSIAATSAEDCCVNNPSGLYFTNGGQCLQCIVYGWDVSSFRKQESETPHQVPLAYSKGPSSVSLIVDIIDTGEGTASRDDYTENEKGVIFLPLYRYGTTSVTFRPDNEALEPDETIVFDLNLVAVNPSFRTSEFDTALPNVFFHQRKVLSIQDGTDIVFRLRDLVREEDEDNGHIEVRVGVEYPLYLASPISLLLTPKVAPVDFTPKPDISSFARANTYPGRLDFLNNPIKLTFPVGRTRKLDAFVPIIDDRINEALEYFIVELSFADPVSVPDTVGIASGRNIVRCDIYDNDDIFIGFQLPSRTYSEEEGVYDATLIKSGITEQTIYTRIHLEEVPPDTLFDLATPSDNYNDNDFAFGHGHDSLLVCFPPNTSRISFSIDIFDDYLPENTEAALLAIDTTTFKLGNGRSPFVELLKHFPTFFIIIKDNDGFRAGFETTSYTVSEGVISQQVCVRMFEPPDDTPITGNFLVGLETIADTADESDFMAMFRFGTFVSFNNDQRRSCVNIIITDDNVYENGERFSLQLTNIGGSFALPDIFVLNPNMSEINIEDDEMVTVGFIDPPYSAREDEGVMIFTVGVTSGHTLDRDIELSFSTIGIAIEKMFAVAGLDYTAISDLRFSLTPGMITFEIPVNLINDIIFEQNEFFRGELTLISGERVVIGEGIANATIIDDEIVCQQLPPLTNGMILYSPDTTAPYLEGTNAEHICNPGFVLSGEEIRVCQNDTTFSGVPTVCIHIICLPLEQFPNGRMEYSPDTTAPYDLSTVATYICNEGFRLDISNGGSETRICIDDMDHDTEGIFDNQAPQCVLINVIRVNDTVIGDPLMTVPLYVQNTSSLMPFLGEDDHFHLCFELHGSSDAYFNLVSDDCVSVNAHYQQIAPGEDINIIDDISIRAVANDGTCHNIEILLDQCTARVDGVVIDGMYSYEGISVRKYPSRVRIAVPNCSPLVRGLVMWVMCQSQTFWSTSRTNPDGSEFTFPGQAIRFVVARGLNLREASHGILGQFWNIPVEVAPYEGPFVEEREDDVATYLVSVNHPGNTEPRQFIGWLRFPSVEYERRMYCLYAGDGHAGPVYEVPQGPPNGPVIEGDYTEYIVSEQFETGFTYSHFQYERCP